MFRRRMLEKRNERDALDQLLVVVTPSSVLAVGALAGVLLVALGWSVLARIPVKVDGQGILLRPGFVRPLESGSDGRVTNLLVSAGDFVEAGQPVAQLSQPELDRELNRLNARFDIRRAFSARQIALARRARALERELAVERLNETRERLTALLELRERSTRDRDAVLADRREMLNRIEALLDTQRAQQAERQTGLEELAERGIASNDARLAALAAVTSSTIEASRVELQIAETRLQEITDVREELDLLRQIQEVEDELTRIEIDEQQAERTFAEFIRTQEESIEELAAEIRSLRTQRAGALHVHSPFRGTVLEVLADEGEAVGVGTPVAIVRIEPQTEFLRVQVDDDASEGLFTITINGVPGGPIRTRAAADQVLASLPPVPALHQHEPRAEGELGLGPVDVFYEHPDDEAHPELHVEVRDDGLTTADGRPATASASILGVHAPNAPMEHVGFFPIGLAKRIEPGMEIRIDPASVEQDRFGSMVGTIVRVGEFAMTEEGMLNIVGNQRVAQSLGGAAGVIMIEALLNPDAEDPTGFEWTSKSPDFPITEGTTTTARVVVEQRRPISFVIPLLRRWLLGQGGADPAAAALGAVR